MQPSGSKETIEDGENPGSPQSLIKNSQEVVTSRFSRRTTNIERLSVQKGSMKNIMTSDMDSEYSPEKRGKKMAESPMKGKRRGTLLNVGGRMKNSQESVMSPNEAGRRSSALSIDSADRRHEIDQDLEELRNMIHPNEWNNIPACIRNAVMGLLDFNDKMTQRVVNENLMLQNRIQNMSDLNIKQQSSIKFQFDEVSAKIDREINRSFKKVQKSSEEMKLTLQGVNDAQHGVIENITKMNVSMEIWDSKIRKLDSKIIDVEKLAETMEKDSKKLEKSLHDLVSNFQSQFKVDGIIGNEKTDLYRDVSTFIRALAEFKDESDVIFSTMSDKKIDYRLKEVFKKIDDQAEESMEYIRIQQTDLGNFRAKLEVLEDDVADLQDATGNVKDADERRSQLSSALSRVRSGQASALSGRSRSHELRQGEPMGADSSSSGDATGTRKTTRDAPIGSMDSKTSSSGSGSSSSPSETTTSKPPTQDNTMPKGAALSTKNDPTITVTDETTPKGDLLPKTKEPSVSKDFDVTNEKKMSKTLLDKRSSRNRGDQLHIQENSRRTTERRQVDKKKSSRFDQGVVESSSKQSKRIDVQASRLKVLDERQTKLIAHLVKYEETVQMRIDAVKDLLFALSNDTKKQGQKTDTLRDYVERNSKDAKIELLMSKESMENELQQLMSQNYAIEAELSEFREVTKEIKDRGSKLTDETAKRSTRQQKASERSRTDKSRVTTQNRTVPPSERSKKNEKQSETNVLKQKKSSFSPGKPRRSQPPIESKATPTKQYNVVSTSEAHSRLQPTLDEVSTFDKLNTVSESQAEQGVNESPESNKKIAVSNLNQRSNKSSVHSKSTSRPREQKEKKPSISFKPMRNITPKSSQRSVHDESRLSQRSIKQQSRHENDPSGLKTTQESMMVNDCELCGGQGYGGPCEQAIEQLRDELRDELIGHINQLFEDRQKSFIKFIEDDLDIETQVNVDGENVVSTFYKHHNTMNKMMDNFRLFEYKRNKYLKNKRAGKSLSPERESLSNASPGKQKDLPSPNKNFMTRLPGVGSNDFRSSADTTHWYESKETNTRLKLRNVNQLNITAPVLQGKHRQNNARVVSQPNMFGIDEDEKNMRRNNQNNKLMTSVPGVQGLNFSSGATQKMNQYTSNQYQNYQTLENQTLPIISTRRAHLTVDQRVWDAEQTEVAKINNSFPADLHNVTTLNDALNATGSEGQVYPPHNQQFQFDNLDIGLVSGKIVKKPQIINQDSSKNTISHPQAFNKGNKTQKAANIPPLQVKFQELNPVKRESNIISSSKNVSPRSNQE